MKVVRGEMPLRLNKVDVNSQDNSTGKDKYQKGMGQRKAKKYLRKSCYNLIKCSVANFLVALM